MIEFRATVWEVAVETWKVYAICENGPYWWIIERKFDILLTYHFYFPPPIWPLHKIGVV